MEHSAEPGYEFTTPRVIFLVMGIVLWLLLGLAAMARDAGGGGHSIGYLIGTLATSLLVAWIVRSGFRLARGRPVRSPAWTPGLFLGAVILQFLVAVGNSTPPS